MNPLLASPYRMCHQSGRDFLPLAANAVYCNVRCRNKAGRKRAMEKARATALPTAAPHLSESLVFQASSPSMEDLVEMIHGIIIAAKFTGIEKNFVVKGTMPEGWERLADEGAFSVPVYVNKLHLTTDPTWSIMVDGESRGVKHHSIMPAVPGVTAAPASYELAAARLRQEELAADRLMDSLPEIAPTVPVAPSGEPTNIPPPVKQKAQDLLEAGALPEGFAPIPILPPAKLTVPPDDKYLFGPATGR